MERYRYIPTINGRFQIAHDANVIANPVIGEENVFKAEEGDGVYTKPWVFLNVLEPREEILVYKTAEEQSALFANP